MIDEFLINLVVEIARDLGFDTELCNEYKLVSVKKDELECLMQYSGDRFTIIALRWKRQGVSNTICDMRRILMLVSDPNFEENIRKTLANIPCTMWDSIGYTTKTFYVQNNMRIATP